MGRHRSSIRGVELSDKKINKHIMHHGLRQPSINNGSHNNQPKKRQPRRREVWRGCATSGTRGGSAIPSFLGRCKLNNWYKLLKWLSLVTIFFSAGLYYLVKPSHRALGQPLPQMLPGWGGWKCKKPACRWTGDQLHHSGVLFWMVRLLSTICLYYSYVSNATVC
jgi:hypothetical protein